MQSLGERSGNKVESNRRMMENFASNLRCAMPGIIQSFDSDAQTATVQIAVRERIIDSSGRLSFVQIKPLVDVPIVVPRAGNFVMTMAPSPGNECLIIFADYQIDYWWSNGGIQNWADKRRHDLSDAFCILGCWSQPNKIQNYSGNTTQLRNLSGSLIIEFPNDGSINITGNIEETGDFIGSGKIQGAHTSELGLPGINDVLYFSSGFKNALNQTYHYIAVENGLIVGYS